MQKQEGKLEYMVQRNKFPLKKITGYVLASIEKDGVKFSKLTTGPSHMVVHCTRVPYSKIGGRGQQTTISASKHCEKEESSFSQRHHMGKQ